VGRPNAGATVSLATIAPPHAAAASAVVHQGVPDCKAAFLRCGVNKQLLLKAGVRYMLRGMLMRARRRLPSDAWLSVAQRCLCKWQTLGIPEAFHATPPRPAGSHDVAEPSACAHIRIVRAIVAIRPAMLAILSSLPGVMDEVRAECKNPLAQVCLKLANMQHSDAPT
jgi:hypothetical protein